MPRPSSALDTKASTVRPLLFDLHPAENKFYSIIKVRKTAGYNPPHEYTSGQYWRQEVFFRFYILRLKYIPWASLSQGETI